MTNKELLQKISDLIHEKFEKSNKYILNALQNISKGQDNIHKDMATKEDMKKLTDTIHLYMEMTRVYWDKQRELEKQIEAILEYLGVSDN